MHASVHHSPFWTSPRPKFLALPSLNKALVLELACSEYVARRENIIAVGNSITAKTHIALVFRRTLPSDWDWPPFGRASVGFITGAAAL